MPSGSAIEVIVVGGGIVGLAVAEELSRRGTRCVLVERRAPGGEASWAAGGMLAADYEPDGPGAFAEFAAHSRTLWHEFGARLAQEWRDVGHRESGTLAVAVDDAELARLQAKLAWLAPAGRRVEWLGPRQARAMEPGLAETIAGAALLPDDGVVNNRAVLLALAAILRARKVEILSGAEAVLCVEGSRVRGVEIDGARFEASRVVVAAGAWSGRVSDGAALPAFHPVRGQMFGYVKPPSALVRPVRWEGGYAVPRGGFLIAGTTVEPAAGFDKRVTAEGSRSVSGKFRAALPALASGTPAHAWAGLRPMSADGLPVIGAFAQIEGLVYAAGLGRDGILLAPATASAVVSLLLDGKAPASIAAFDPTRAALRTTGKIVLNGAPRSIGARATVASLVAELDLVRQGIAVAVNEEVIRRGDWETVALKDNDRVEIIHAVGGG